MRVCGINMYEAIRLEDIMLLKLLIILSCNSSPIILKIISWMMPKIDIIRWIFLRFNYKQA